MSHENEVEQLNIAICDDEENIRIYIRKLIQKQEPFCKITEFSSGKELLEFQDETNAEEIDILFLDISMGDEDGMTVAKQLGWETVRFVLAEYGGGATSIEALHPCYYESVFNALFDYEAGMKD